MKVFVIVDTDPDLKTVEGVVSSEELAEAAVEGAWSLDYNEYEVDDPEFLTDYCQK